MPASSYRACDVMAGVVQFPATTCALSSPRSADVLACLALILAGSASGGCGGVSPEAFVPGVVTRGGVAGCGCGWFCRLGW